MGKPAARLFHGLSVLVFSLCFLKVLSAPSESTRSIIDVIENDENLCERPKFLNESNITGECRNVTYPKVDFTSERKRENVFLCFAFYDTLYKYCQTRKSKSQMLFNNITTFDTYIQKLFPKPVETNQSAYCENAMDIKFSYDKLQFLSTLRFDVAHICNTRCFDKNGKFVLPLCGILAWHKSINDELKEINIKKGTESHSVLPPKVPANTQSHKKVQESGTSAKEILDENVDEGIKIHTVDEKDSSVNNVIGIAQDNEKDKSLRTDIDKQTTEKEKVESNPAISGSKIGQEQKAAENDKSVPTDPKRIDIKDIIDTKQEPSDTKLEIPNRDDSDNIGNAVTTQPKNDANTNEGINVPTISENTEDHDTSVNQEDWNLADDKLLDRSDDQIMNTVDQVQSAPEPSEQREIISHYRNIRTDGESHFFTYFTILSLVSIAAYIGYHNKQKLIAIVLEGRRSRNSRGRRRPSTANYRKLDCTLEEAVTSQCNANVTHVIY